MPETSLILRAQNFTKQAFDQIQQSLNKTADHFSKLAQESKQTEKGIVGSLNRVKASLQANQEGFQSIAIGAGAVAASTGLLAKSFVDAAMRLERMKMELTAVMGSSVEAEKQFARLREVAKLPGLGLGEAIAGATRLQVVGASAEEAARQLTAFGGAVARAGGGRAELARVVEQIAQMSAKSEVLMEDFRPIVSLMPDIMKAMQSAFGTKQIEQIREMGVSSQKFIAGITTELLKLPGVGNTAANAMENLNDSLFILRAELGQFLLPTFKKIIDAVSSVVVWINKLSNTQKSFLAWGTAITAIIATLTASFMGFLMIIPSIISGATALGITLAGLSAAAGPIGLAIAAIGALVVGILLWQKHQQDSIMTTEKFASTMTRVNTELEKLARIESLANQMEVLRGKTNLTAEEAQKLHAVQKELAELSPRLIAGYDAQGNVLIKTKKQVIEYTDEQRKLLEAEKELTKLHAQRRLPELGEKIEKETERLEKYEDILRKKPISTKGTFWIPDPRMPGQVLATYDQLIKVTKKQNEKVQALAEERRDLEAQLRGKPFGPPIPPKAEMPEISAKAAKKAEELVSELRKRELELISDRYEKEREEAKLIAEEKIAGYKKEIKDTEQLSRAIAIEKQILAKKLTDINREEAEERAKIAEKEAKENQERLNAWVKNRVQAGVIATNAELKEIEKRKFLEQKALEEAALLYSVHEEQIKASLNRIAKAAMQEMNDDIQARKEASRIKIGITDTYFKILQAQREQNQQAEEVATNKSVQEYERRMREHDYATEKILENSEKEVQAFVEQVRITKENEKAILDMKLDFADQAAQAIAELPSHLIDTYLENRRLEQEAQEDIIDINKSAQEEIDSIRNDTTLSYIERLRQIEQTERESAQRRKAIEQDLNESKKSYFADYVQSFLAGIARMIQAEMQRRIALGILNLILPGAGTAVGMVAPVVFGPGFDNPKHDAIARSAGFMYGASFDNPVSDMQARLRGTMSASEKLGERSAKDMVTHFSKGFEQGAGRQGNQVHDNQLQGVLSRLEKQLSETPQYNFYLDGQQLHASVRRRDDKTNFRRSAY